MGEKTLTNQAFSAFKSSDFALALSLYGQLAVKLGHASFKANLELCNRRSEALIKELPFSCVPNIEFYPSHLGPKITQTKWTHLNVNGFEKVSVKVTSNIKIEHKKIILKIKQYTKSGKEITPPQNSSHFSETHGWFKYVNILDASPEKHQESANITVAKEASSVAFAFVNIGETDTSNFTASLALEQSPTKKQAIRLERRIFDHLKSDVAKESIESRAIIYGDISPNVLDGSSIWLTSLVNILSENRKTILLLKDNLKSYKVLTNIIKSQNLIIIEPRDIDISGALSPKDAAEIISFIYAHCPRVTAVISRGVEIGHELQKQKIFHNVLYPYITDFYEIDEQGLKLNPEKINKVKEIVLNAKTILCQTKDIYRKIEEIVGYPFDWLLLPPSIPDQLMRHESNKLLPVKNSEEIHIGYAGKVQQRWGVIELIEEVYRQVSEGKKITLHIATGKIYGKGDAGVAFVNQINNLLNHEFIKLYENLSREDAISLMDQMDLVWCYRDPNLENSTLELSTKLIESAALGKPCLAYASHINKGFLGEDYPFLVQGISDIGKVICELRSRLLNAETHLEKLSTKTKNNHGFSSIRERLTSKLDQKKGTAFRERKIVISGHDLKFIYPYITHLRNQGAYAAIDPWQWGECMDADITNHYSSWAEIIFCEWGLANAVWHSKYKKPEKKLLVRIHAQEVRQKAEKFGRQLESKNVEKFIFVSPVIRDKALDLFGWGGEKSILVSNAVRDNRFYSQNKAVKPVLGMVGIVPSTKRLDRALDLLESLNKRNWGAKLYCKGYRPEDLEFMHAAGRKAELAYYQKLYDRIRNSKNLNNHVIFDEWGNDVEQWYSKIDFILSPSDNESFHYALADGVMAGCMPLVWPWDGAADTYSSEWIVNDVYDATKKIENIMMASQEDQINQRNTNRDFIFNKYGESRTYNILDEVLLN